jgi:hypothetical protein
MILSFNHLALTVSAVLSLLLVVPVAAATQSRFTNKPRIRREWRTLTPEMRMKVAE